MDGFESKEDYLARIDQEIKSIDARIDLLNSRIKALDIGDKEGFRNEYDRLFSEKEDLKNEIATMQGMPSNDWKEIREVFESRWQNLKDRIDELDNKV